MSVYFTKSCGPTIARMHSCDVKYAMLYCGTSKSRIPLATCCIWKSPTSHWLHVVYGRVLPPTGYMLYMEESYLPLATCCIWKSPTSHWLHACCIWKSPTSHYSYMLYMEESYLQLATCCIWKSPTSFLVSTSLILTPPLAFSSSPTSTMRGIPSFSLYWNWFSSFGFFRYIISL